MACNVSHSTSQQPILHFIHVKQLHAPTGKNTFLEDVEPTQEIIEEVVQSQLNVIKVIKEHPNSIVLSEGLCENIHSPDAGDMRVAAIAVFPQGVPLDCDELTALQKEFIYEYGGEFTLFYLGKISSIYKSIHKELGDDIHQQVQSGDFSNIDLPREKEVIACAKEAVIERYGSLNGSTVLAVFGAIHNLKPLCDQEGFSYESIETRSAQTILKTNLAFVQKREILKSNAPKSYESQRAMLETHFPLIGSDTSSIDKFIDIIKTIRIIETPNEIRSNSFTSPYLEKLNEGIQNCPGNITIRLARASFHMNTQNFDNAKVDYEYVLNEYPKNIEAQEGMQRALKKSQLKTRKS